MRHMTLEEYRIQILDRIKACQDSVAARDVLAEVDVALSNAKMSSSTQQEFWTGLHDDLEVVAEDARFLDKRAAARIGAIANAARGWISRNHLKT